MFKRRSQADKPTPSKNESVFKKIDQVIWILVRMVGPMVAAAILTPHFAVLLLLVTALLCWLSARIGMKKIANSISWGLRGVVLGTAFSFFYWLPFWFDTALD